DALVFYLGGGGEILSQSLLENPEQRQHISDAVGGFFILLWEGALPKRLEDNREQNRHPRSAAGLSADGKTLYLLVIDGRRPGSAGATETETGLILKRLGAFTGLNLDGGGSTALALRRSDGKVRTLNTPVHGGIPGRERGVASCLGIRIRAD
ncbi:MAG: phosphodiester glycosidase family protein, partial [Treponema sp.]|nr:phosphodiester glycosidase family protein [Treponema sp.]